jgi:hypothetical protein
MDTQSPDSGVDPFGGARDRAQDDRGEQAEVAEDWVELEPPTVEWEGETRTVVRRAHVTESEYVFKCKADTLVALASGLKDHDGKRVDRTEAYAKWRYRGFLAGEIASL